MEKGIHPQEALAGTYKKNMPALRSPAGEKILWQDKPA
jgi:hypothetical protein